MDEEDLVRRARQGDQAAFRQLLAAYATLTERTARVLLTDRSDAEDAVQEAWLDAWRGLSTFQPGRPFRPWILAILYNRCRMVARKARRAGLLYQLPPGVEVAVYPFGKEGEASNGDLEAALATLDEGQRQLLALRFFADLQLTEIAALLDVPEGTVKSRLHRTLAALRERLQQPSPAPNRQP